MYKIVWQHGRQNREMYFSIWRESVKQFSMVQISLKATLEGMICLFLMGGSTVSMSLEKLWIIYHFWVESQLYYGGKGISFLSTSFLEKVMCAHWKYLRLGQSVFENTFRVKSYFDGQGKRTGFQLYGFIETSCEVWGAFFSLTSQSMHCWS